MKVVTIQCFFRSFIDSPSHNLKKKKKKLKIKKKGPNPILNHRPIIFGLDRVAGGSETNLTQSQS